VSPVVNDVREQNRTLEVEVEMTPDPTAPQPKPGTSADVEIILDTREGVLRVPTNAVIESKQVLWSRTQSGVAPVTTASELDWSEVTEASRKATGVTSLDRLGVPSRGRPAAPVDGGREARNA
jgi:HlyD family secretion protein